MTVQTQTEETPQLAAARQLLAAGISVIPVRADGSKAPAVNWKEFQQRRATPAEIDAWFGPGSTFGVGAVTGDISGNLLMIEFEARAAHLIAAVRDLAAATGQEALWEKVCGGWKQLSPSGGVHFLVRTEQPTPGNQKLAADANGEVLAETRGRGGYVIVAPSNGGVHPSGKPYRNLGGGPDTAPAFTEDELENVFTLISAALGQAPSPEPGFHQPGGAPRERTGPLSPGDDFEARTDWADILEPHGWTFLFERGNERFWRRPGKTSGISATTGYAEDRDRLYVFSTNAGLPTLEPITEFHAHALLNHGGDHAAAARELRRQGFGDPPPGSPGAAKQAAGDPERARSYLDGAFDAEWLMEQDFPPIRYVVKDLIPEGLTILAGPPKIGKSWLVLDIGLAVSCGQQALGSIATEQRPVLYLALEDGKRRLQSRLATLGATKPSANLTFITTAPSADIAATIGEFFHAHAGRDPVVFLDTWGKAVRPAVGGETTYERDYKVAGGLKALADAHPGSSIIVVHHTRKSERSDFVDAVSGTQGIAGAADTVLVLRRARGETTGTLSATSRDTKEGEYRINLDGVGRWTLEGRSLEAAAEAEQTAKATAGVGDRMTDVIEAVHRFPEGISAKDLKILLTNMDPGDVDTYLSRAHSKGRIRRIKRGLYAPLPAVSGQQTYAKLTPAPTL